MNQDLIGDRNPAAMLHELLLTWAVTTAHESTYGQRGGDSNFWSASVEAIRWCDLSAEEVRRQGVGDPAIVNEMAPVVQHCRSAIFALAHGFGTLPDDRVHIDASALLALRLFSRSWDPVTLDPEAGADVLDLVIRVRELVVDAADLSLEVQDYITRLTLSIEATLRANKIWGTVDLRDQTMQLAAAVQAFVVGGEGVEETRRTVGKSLAHRLFGHLSTTFWSDVVPLIVGAGWSGAQKALEQGPPSHG